MTGRPLRLGKGRSPGFFNWLLFGLRLEALVLVAFGRSALFEISWRWAFVLTAKSWWTLVAAWFAVIAIWPTSLLKAPAGAAIIVGEDVMQAVVDFAFEFGQFPPLPVAKPHLLESDGWNEVDF